MNIPYRWGLRLSKLLQPNNQLQKISPRQPFPLRLIFIYLSLVFIVGTFAGYACLANAQSFESSPSYLGSFSAPKEEITFHSSRAKVSFTRVADSPINSAENGGSPRSEIAQRQIEISTAQSVAVPFRICFIKAVPTRNFEVQRGTSTAALELDSNVCYDDEIQANSTLSEIFYIYGTDDDIDEPDELVILQLREDPDRNLPTTVAPIVAIDAVNILDDDPTMVTLARVDSGFIYEGGSEPTEFTIKLSRSLLPGETIEVPVLLGDISSANEVGAELKRGSEINNGVVLLDGHTTTLRIIFYGHKSKIVQTANLLLFANEDRKVEENDSVSVQLGPNDTSSTGFNHPDITTEIGGGARASTTDKITVPIKDDPNTVPVKISVDRSGIVSEADGTLNINASLGTANQSGTVLSIPIRVRKSATTAASDDYELPSAITIADGQTSGSAVFKATDNADDEPNKRVVVEFTKLPFPLSSEGSDHVAITITDDDATPVTFASAATSIAERGAIDRTDITIKLGRGLKNGERMTVPIKVSGAMVDTHYRLDLKSGPATPNTGVSISKSGLHSAQNPAVEFTGQATQVVDTATLELEAIYLPDSVARTVELAFGTGKRAPSWTNLDGGIKLAGSPQRVKIIDVDGEPPTVSIARNSKNNVYESSNVTFTLTLSEIAVSATTISVDVSQKGDFLQSGEQGIHTVSIPSGETSVEFVVALDDDSQDEGEGEITATVQSGVGYRVSESQASASVTVYDDDGLPTVSMQIDPNNDVFTDADGNLYVSEGGSEYWEDAINFRINIHPVMDSPVTVNLKITATGSVIYPGSLGRRSVVIPANTPSVSHYVRLDDDSIDENQGSVSVAIRANAAYRIARSPNNSTTVMVLDDDPTAVVLTSAADLMLTEGDPESPVEVYISLTRSLEAGETVSVPLQLSSKTGVVLPGSANPEIKLGFAGTGISASGIDSSTPTIQFTGHASRRVQTGIMTITPTTQFDQDSSVDTILVDLGTPTAGGLNDIQPNRVFVSHKSQVSLKIEDSTVAESTPIAVLLSVPDNTATMDDSTDTAELRLTLNRPLVDNESLAVPLLFEGAEPDRDFTLALAGAPNGVSFDAGTRTVTFSGSTEGTAASEASILLDAHSGDNLNDRIVTVFIPAESFGTAPVLVTSNLPDGATGSRKGEGEISLVGNLSEFLPVVLISPSSDYVNEGASAQFVISVDPAPVDDLSVLVTVSDDVNTDYLLPAFEGNHRVIIKAGQKEVLFNVPVRNDSGVGVDEPNGEIHLNVRENLGVYNVSVGFAAVTVIDDDETVVALDVGTGNLVEGGSKRLTVRLNRGLVNGERLEVPLQFLGTAIRNADYTLTGQLPAGTGVSYANLEYSGNDQDSIAKVIFTGPVAGESAAFADLVLSAKDDDLSEHSESVAIAVVFQYGESGQRPSWDGLGGGAKVVQSVPQFKIYDTGVNPVDLSVNGGTTHTVSEGAAAFDITATLTAVNETGSALNIPIVVNAAQSTADNDDYSIKSSISITPGSRTGTASFTVIDDSRDEPNEQVFIELTDELPQEIVPGSDKTVTVTIRDNDPTLVSLVRTDSGEISEGGTGQASRAEFTVSLKRRLVTGESLEVPLIISGESITESDFELSKSSDFDLNQGVVLSNASTLMPIVTFVGQDAVTVQEAKLVLTATVDEIEESAELLDISLGFDDAKPAINASALRASLADGGTISHTEHHRFQIVIASEVQSFVHVPATASVVEDRPNSGEIELRGEPSIDTGVTLRYSDGTATGGIRCGAGVDFVSDSVAFGLRTGKSVRRVKVLSTCADIKDEPNESYTLNWKAQFPVFDASAPNCTSPTVCTTEVVIQDDDPTTVELTIPDATATEGSASNTALIKLTLSRALTGDEQLTVPLIFPENTLDRLFKLQLQGKPQGVSLDMQGVITFAAEDSISAVSATIVMTALPDKNTTDDKVSVSIPKTNSLYQGLEFQRLGSDTQPVEYVKGGDITITDMGLPVLPVVNFAVAAGEVNESIGQPKIRVELDAAASRDIELTFSVSGSASIGEDYSISQINADIGSITIKKDADYALIPVRIIDDDLYEKDKKLVLTLNPGSGYAIGAKDVYTLTIEDNDPLPKPIISISAQGDIEEGQLASFVLRADTTLSNDLDIDLTVTQTGAFIQASDLGLTTATILAGQRLANFKVATVDDVVHETPGAVTVSINAGKGYVVGADRVAAVAVQDNDPLLSPDLAQLWLTRFGRVVTGEIVESIEDRLQGTHRSEGITAKLAGTPIDSSRGHSSAGRPDPTDDLGEYGRANSKFYQALAELRDPTKVQASNLQKLTERGFLTGSEFSLTGETRRGNSTGSWGRGYFLDIDGQTDTVSIQGDVKGITLGHDVAGVHSGREYLVGILLSYAAGSGQFNDTESSGEIESTLQVFVPYGSMQVNEELNLWGAAGAGFGRLTVNPEQGLETETDVDWQMLAGGFDHDLRPMDKFGLSLYGDLSRTWTRSEQTETLNASDSQTSKLRLGLKLTGERTLSKNSVLHFSSSAALRHDSGDAETGNGVEIGGEIGFTGTTGLKIKAEGRALLVHSDSRTRDQGYAVSLQYDPEPTTVRGFFGSLGVGIGLNTGSSVLSGNGNNGGTHIANSAEPEWRTEVAYGTSIRQGLGTSPYAILSGNDDINSARFGVRIDKDRDYAPDFQFDLYFSAERLDAAGTRQIDLGGGVFVSKRW